MKAIRANNLSLDTRDRRTIGSTGPTLLFEDTFETGAPSVNWTETYSEAAKYFPNTAQYQTQSDVKYSGTYAANYFIPTGATSDSQPLKYALYPSATASKDIYTQLGTLREIYFEWYEFFTTGYPWPVTSQKIFQLGYFDANELVPIVGDNTQDWEMMCVIHGDSATIVNQYYHADFINARGAGTYWTMTNGASPSPPARAENVWVKCGFHLKLNSGVGVTDGFMRWYMDEVNMLTYVALPYLWPGDINAVPLCDALVINHPINSVAIGLNWSNPTGTAGADGNRYIDQIKIYATKP